jgi:ParB family protein of integrating conjugative element (PFGI_1 class)
MIMKKAPDLSDALLMRGKKPVQPADHSGVSVLPVSEMAMVLTLDQLRPNPDNPRTTRNPRYEDIKASIRTRGLDSIPKVTRDPDGEDVFIFSDGGNTRYEILCDLWQETGDERFYRVHTIFKP